MFVPDTGSGALSAGWKPALLACRADPWLKSHILLVVERAYILLGIRSLDVTGSDIPETVSTAEANKRGSVCCRVKSYLKTSSPAPIR